jgi:transcriptional regulator with XRE-family HTH domain
LTYRMASPRIRLRMAGDESTASRGEETVGERVRRLRVEKGLTQGALSSPGLTDAQISRIESGKRQPSLRAIRRIARKLGVSLDYLETGADLSTREELDLSHTLSWRRCRKRQPLPRRPQQACKAQAR